MFENLFRIQLKGQNFWVTRYMLYSFWPSEYEGLYNFNVLSYTLILSNITAVKIYLIDILFLLLLMSLGKFHLLTYVLIWEGFLL